VSNGVVALSQGMTDNANGHLCKDLADITVLAPEVITGRGTICLVITKGIVSPLGATLLDDVDLAGRELFNRLSQHQEECVCDCVGAAAEARASPMNHIVEID